MSKKEFIKKIESLDNFKIPDGDRDWGNYQGFKITTNQQEIYFGIDNSSSCCESWGHICSEDSFEQFIGAQLKTIEKVSESLNKKIADLAREDYDSGGIIFINFETSEGTLQFAVYNAHNGYYGHSVEFKSEQLKFEESI